MFGVNRLRERIAILERDVKKLIGIVDGAIPIAVLDKDSAYVLIVPEDTTDEQCVELSNIFDNVDGIVLRGNKFKILEIF